MALINPLSMLAAKATLTWQGVCCKQSQSDKITVIYWNREDEAKTKDMARVVLDCIMHVMS